mgnify:CR=1 FL=1
MIAAARAQVQGPSSWSQVQGGSGSVASRSSPAPRKIVGPSWSGAVWGSAAGFGAVFMQTMLGPSSARATGATAARPRETRRTRGMTPTRDRPHDRPTSPGEPAVAFELEGTEPLPPPLPAPRDPSDVSADEVNAELARVGQGIAALRIHGRRLRLALAAEALAATVAAVPMTDVWSMARVVAESLGEPAGKAFEDGLLELLRAAKDPAP